MGLSVGLDTAVRALRAHQLGIDIASHNVANASTPGFSRQRVLLRPIGLTGSSAGSNSSLLGRAGFGVDASDVNRVRNPMLDFQARTSISSQAQYGVLADALSQSELIFNEPSDEGVGAALAQFWNAWQDVVNDPEASASRTTLAHATTTLSLRMNSVRAALVVQREDLNLQLKGIAGEINSRATQIADLNLQIKQVELNGEMANDLRDRRDVLLDELAGLGDISYQEQGDSTVNVYLGSHELVFLNQTRAVSVVNDAANPGMNKLIWTQDTTDVVSGSGSLRGILDARDTEIPNLIAKADALAGALITEVNAIHQTGFGLDGTTGLDFFTGTDASDIAFNAVLSANKDQIATAAAAGAVGDGSIALAIANLQLAQTMNGGTSSIDEYYADIVSVLGADTARAQGSMEAHTLFASHLEGLRQSVSGVSLDEEMVNLNAAQHAYEAAARVITAIDDMLDVLINRTGIVGR